MKLIYIGYAIPFQNCYKKRGVAISGNNFQLGLLSSLHQSLKDDLISVTIYPIATFPKEKVFKINYKKERLIDTLDTYYVPFINIPVIKQITIMLNLNWIIKNIIKKNKKEKIIILGYNAYPFVSFPILLNRRYESLCFLVDPPLSHQKEKRFIKQILSNLWLKVTKWTIPLFDKIIVLNKDAAKIFAPKLPYIVVDCGIERKRCLDRKKFTNSEDYSKDKSLKKIVFTGALHQHSGIINLVKSMEYLKNNNAKLFIYGEGPLQKEIYNLSLSLDNVEYCGFIPSDKIQDVYSEAYLLLNPSDINNPINQVAFPSKLMEYMISGRPVLTSKLKCIEKEYTPHVYFFTSSDPKQMARDIDDVLKIPVSELQKKANSAYNFILNSKTWDYHAKNILKFIEYGEK